jgi:transposase
VRRDSDACCLYALRELAARPSASSQGDDLDGLVAHLYICQGLSTYQISEIVGASRQRVQRMLKRAGVPVKPRGAGRPRRARERAALDDLMARLYVESGWTSGQIAALAGISQRSVRDRLRHRGVRIRTRGQLNREDRLSLPEDVLQKWYVTAGLSAAETGRLLGVSGQIVLRATHDAGLPVRMGGPPPRHGPAEIELIEALYADEAVRRALRRHAIPRRPAGGPIWQRFPVPLPVSPELADELYVGCGLAARHIELLTGQPSQTVFRLLKDYGIDRRPAGGRAPFMRRWRARNQDAAHSPGCFASDQSDLCALRSSAAVR